MNYYNLSFSGSFSLFNNLLSYVVCEKVSATQHIGSTFLYATMRLFAKIFTKNSSTPVFLDTLYRNLIHLTWIKPIIVLDLFTQINHLVYWTGNKVFVLLKNFSFYFSL